MEVPTCLNDLYKICNDYYYNKLNYNGLLPSMGGCIALGVGLLAGWRLQKARPDLWSRLTYDYKLTLVVPNDVHFMSKNAVVRHCTSASILAYKNASTVSRLECWLWTLTGQRKIVVKADAVSDFKSICQQAQALGVCQSIVNQGDRNAVLALGPAPARLLDRITAKFKLY